MDAIKPNLTLLNLEAAGAITVTIIGVVVIKATGTPAIIMAIIIACAIACVILRRK